MTERDEVRDQIARALNYTIGNLGLDAVMAIVDPIVSHLNAQLLVRSEVEEVLDEELGTESTPKLQGGYVANVRLMVNRLRVERATARALFEAEAKRNRTVMADTQYVLWLHAEAVWQLDEARAKLQHAKTYADNCAKHATVEVLRGDVAWHLRQIVTQPPHNCADASCSIQIDACGACCTCLGGCVYNGPDEPTGEVLIELRDWLITGEQIADDPEEHGLRTFVPTDEIHEIIAAYLKANGITPPAGQQ